VVHVNRRREIDRLMLIGIVLAWLAGRALVTAEAIRRVQPPGELSYFVAVMQRWDVIGIQGTLREYPTPAAYLFRGVWLAAGSDKVAFGVLFVCIMLALDAVFTVLLWRAARPETRLSAVAVWAGFVPLLGAITYVRFDLVPAVLAAVAVLWISRRPALSGAAVGLGAAVKLWPALLVLPLLGRPSSRRRVLLGFIVAGFGLAALSLVLGGWSRLVSPLGYQSGRGLQIESVLATPVMVLWGAGSAAYKITLTKYHSWDITGPGAGVLATGTTVATALGLLFLAWLAFRVVKHKVTDQATIALLALVTTAVMMITNKVLSPQYLIWLGPVLVTLIAVHGPTPETFPDQGLGAGRETVSRQSLRTITLLTLIATVLTHVIYPMGYANIVRHTPASLGTALILATRNATLVVLTVAASVLAVRVTRPERQVALVDGAK
jgi:hypothetical protein